MEANRAIVSEVPEAEIRQIKQEYIIDQIKQSIADFGNYPKMFGRIIRTAIIELVLLTTKVLNKAMELKQKLFEAEHSDWFEAKSKVAMEPPITENVVEAAIDEPIPTKQVTDESIIEEVIATEISEPEIIEEVKPQIPPKPEAVIYPKLEKIDAELKQQNRIIFDAEHERSLLEIEGGEMIRLSIFVLKFC